MDILERLRSIQNTSAQYAGGSDIMREAADEIESLRANLAEAEKYRKDAERYKLARSGDTAGDEDIVICRVIWQLDAAEGRVIYGILFEEEADHAIDAAIAKGEK